MTAVIGRALNIGMTIGLNQTFAIVTWLHLPYIWLAGVERAAYSDASIGFHSAVNTKNSENSGVGNAVLGAYLSRLGFNYDAIIYRTQTKSQTTAQQPKPKSTA